MGRRWLTGKALAVLASVATPWPAAAVPAAAVPGARWIWSLDSAQVYSVNVDFVRGTAVIVRRAGPVRVEVEKRSALGKQHQVSIDVDDQLGRIRISDRYPAPLGWQWSECHPVTARGNFWDSDVRLHVAIYAPADADISVRFMDGTQKG